MRVAVISGFYCIHRTRPASLDVGETGNSRNLLLISFAPSNVRLARCVMQNLPWCPVANVSLLYVIPENCFQYHKITFFLIEKFLLLHFINTRTFRTTSPCLGCASPRPGPLLPEHSRLFRPPSWVAAVRKSAASTPTAAGAALASITTPLRAAAASRPRRRPSRPLAGARGR